MTREAPIPKDQCPAELPVKPVGWHQRLEMHMSLDRGGIGTYTLFDDQGRTMPIQYQYDSQKPKPPGPRGGKAVVPGPTGFVIIDAAEKGGFWGPVVPWRELRRLWVDWMAGKPNPDVESDL